MKKSILMFILLLCYTSVYSQNHVKIIKGSESVFSHTSDVDSVTFHSFTCGDKVLYGGEVYPTVLIGSQCWFARNLNIGTRINGSQNAADNGIIEKYCNGDNENNCNTYGGLYQWNEAMQYETTSGAKGICPTGWHIPTIAELTTLSNAAGGVSTGGNALKAIGQGVYQSPSANGIGTNTSGFSALLGGYRQPFVAYYGNIGANAYFLSSSEMNSTYTNYMYLLYNYSTITLTFIEKDFGFSVRCLKD